MRVIIFVPWMLGKPALTPTTSRYEDPPVEGRTLGMPRRAIRLMHSRTIASRPRRLSLETLETVKEMFSVRVVVPFSRRETATSNIPKVRRGCPFATYGAKAVLTILKDLKPDVALQEACKRVCQDFPDLFKQELGCLKDFQLEIQFKPDSNPYSVNCA